MDSFSPHNISRFSLTNDTSPASFHNYTRLGLLSHSPYSPLQALIIGLILLIIIIVTIVGNILVCIAVCIVRKLRRPCNYLLVSLAVSDLCVAILVMPMALLYEVSGKWNFGFMMCNLWVSFDVLSCTASILNLCMISVDRYYAITKPLEYGVKRTPKRMILCVVFVWLGAACISLPPLIVLGNDYREDNGVSFCSVCQNYGYQIYATLGSFYIPLTVMITVYYKIFCAARKIVAEEKRAQSHIIMEHCYLQIHNNSSPATNSNRGHTHRTSTTSTNTTVRKNNLIFLSKSNFYCLPLTRRYQEIQESLDLDCITSEYFTRT